ncbi:MAG: hypothetical protein Fur0046_01330 [Cyanobacteria bacterium J069]|nr:MAG: hypothetical protein D6742_13115 [Cyanobacteria bacterium J069]
MNPTQKSLLTLLGCSGSLALSMALPDAGLSQTVPVRELIFSSTQTGEMVPPDGPACTCGATDAVSAGWDGSDAEGEMAIAFRGCDCAGCRSITRQEMQRQMQASVLIRVEMPQ